MVFAPTSLGRHQQVPHVSFWQDNKWVVFSKRSICTSREGKWVPVVVDETSTQTVVMECSCEKGTARPDPGHGRSRHVVCNRRRKKRWGFSGTDAVGTAWLIFSPRCSVFPARASWQTCCSDGYENQERLTEPRISFDCECGEIACDCDRCCPLHPLHPLDPIPLAMRGAHAFPPRSRTPRTTTTTFIYIYTQ